MFTQRKRLIINVSGTTAMKISKQKSVMKTKGNYENRDL